jgi:maltooligosyltrehalose trehalohydrolase
LNGSYSLSLGATPLGDGRCRFLVYAPHVERAEVRILSPRERTVLLARDENGYHQAVAKDAPPGATYLYRLDGTEERPDPASRSQPQGAHGPSQVVDSGGFRWEAADWSGLPLEAYILYELHVGTFTPEGTFDAVIACLDELQDLGITAIELMPVAQFPGTRNWGYDGVYPFAVQDSYGGPEGLRRLVDACHKRELAVVLDVVFNHLGPEGNYLGDFGPYFTDRYRTPWGKTINFDGPHSDEVRRYFIENALCWLTEYSVDALRLDAIHGIVDTSAYPFLAELGDAVRTLAAETSRKLYLIPESNLNDARVITSREQGGYGLDAQWNDDFHHALHALLTGETAGYYADFGTLEQLARAYRDGFVYSGQYSRYRRRRHGNSSRHIGAGQLVVFSQNHDQVGNRMHAERLASLVSHEALKLAAGSALLSPFLPLIFMGEEYGEIAPFYYFISHSDENLIEAVRQGRKAEFSAFAWEGELPDPQDETTYLRSRLDHRLRGAGRHKTLLAFYRELIRLRKDHPVLSRLSKTDMEVTAHEAEGVMVVRRWSGPSQTATVLHFGSTPVTVSVVVPRGRWDKVVDSAEGCWGGAGSTVPESVQSHGTVALSLPPNSVLLFSLAEEPS